MELEEDQEMVPALPPPYQTGALLKRNRRGNRGWSEKKFILDRDHLHYTDAEKQQQMKKPANGRRLSQAPPPPTMSSLYLKDCRIWKVCTRLSRFCVSTDLN